MNASEPLATAPESIAGIVETCPAAPRARRMRLPPLAAAAIASALATVPRGKRTAFVEIIARELGIGASWVYARTAPFRRRQRCFDIASLAAALRDAPHGARVALVDELARKRDVSRATVYRWLAPFRRRARERIDVRRATAAAHASARAAA